MAAVRAEARRDLLKLWQIRAGEREAVAAWAAAARPVLPQELKAQPAAQAH